MLTGWESQRQWLVEGKGKVGHTWSEGPPGTAGDSSRWTSRVWVGAWSPSHPQALVDPVRNPGFPTSHNSSGIQI